MIEKILILCQFPHTSETGSNNIVGPLIAKYSDIWLFISFVTA